MSREMPRYRSHKEVHALKIAAVDGLRILFADDGFDPIDVDPPMFARYTPVPGDYYVVYDDGYASISPAKAFEEGYALMTLAARPMCENCGSEIRTGIAR